MIFYKKFYKLILIIFLVFVLSTLLNQVRDFASEPNLALCPSYSTITAISSSDWLNGILHVNSVGETLALFPHQILKIPEKHKTLKTKRLVSVRKIIYPYSVRFAG